MAYIINDSRLTKVFALFLFFLMVVEPCFIYRARCQTMPNVQGHYGSRNLPSVAANALPDLRNMIQGVGDVVQNAVEPRLDIYQNQEHGIIEWNSFNIGTDAHVNFDQQGNADWQALNRIYDASPSQIFGQLTADGKVYLINQNGILFGPDSRVNVHTLVASSLNISNEDFFDSLLNFSADNYMGDPDYLTPGVVSNHGNLETQTNGAVFLIGPNVENAGSIDSAFGQVGLVAGTDVALYLDPYNPSRTALFVDVSNPPEGSTAVNFEGARISADVGTAGMYGCAVNQEGLVRAVTAVQKNGQIELQASRRVVTGENSVTSSPISDDPTQVHQSFEFNGGRIEITGLAGEPVEQIEHNGLIEAPAGSVLLDAQDRVYLGEESRVDVSGNWIDRPVEDTQVTLQLNSVELRDEHLQKDGLLQGETIYVNPLEGSNIGDISGALAYEEKSAQERSTYGGEIIISAPSGDIIQRQGAEVDFSGGGVNYQDGTLEVTQLRSGEEVYDISDAPDHIQYDEVFTATRQVAGYVEGDDAGSLKLIARGVVLDGSMDGSAVQGPYQTETAEPVDELGNQVVRGVKVPERGTLVIGENIRTASSSDPDYVLDEIVIADEVTPLPSDFTPESDLGSVTGTSGSDSPYVSEYSDAVGALYRSTVSAETLNGAGLGTIQIACNTRITIEPDADIHMASSGKFQAITRRIEHYGNITVPSGIVDFILSDTFTSPANFQYDPTRQVSDLTERLYVADGSVISVAGDQTDNFTHRYDRPVQVAFTEGGTITLIESTGRDRSADIIIKKDAQIDVSGGYEIQVNGDQQGEMQESCRYPEKPWLSSPIVIRAI